MIYIDENLLRWLTEVALAIEPLKCSQPSPDWVFLLRVTHIQKRFETVPLASNFSSDRQPLPPHRQHP